MYVPAAEKADNPLASDVRVRTTKYTDVIAKIVIAKTIVSMNLLNPILWPNFRTLE